MATKVATDNFLSDADYKKLTNKPLVRSVDMSHEKMSESLDVITQAVEKQATKVTDRNWEAAAQTIKTSMDKKFGAAWHVVVGEGFGFEMTFQSTNMIYVFFGNVGVLAYKC